MSSVREQVEETERDAILVEDAALIRMMGFPVLEALPSRTVPYEQVDPFILVHEGRMRLVGGGEGRHEASPPRIRQPLVRDRGLGQHRPQHGPERSDRAGAPVRGSAPGAQDGQRRLACRGDRGRRDRRGPRRYRVPRRAVLGEPRSEGQAGRTERAGPATGRDPGAARGRRDRPDPGRRGLARAAGDAGADRRRGTARRRTGDDPGAARVPGVRLPARGRGRRSAPTSAERSRRSSSCLGRARRSP